MMERMATLAAEVERRWRAERYESSVFPEICRQALDEMRAHEGLSRKELVAALPDLTRWSAHPAAGALTLYRSSRFSIFAHLWTDGIATPHQHAWLGAFQLLEGSALHATFDFEERERTSYRLRFGQLETRSIELLGAGDVVPVTAGSRYIHGLWHVERPSIGLSVRTMSLGDEPTLDYRFPGVAWQQRVPEDASHQIFKLLDFFYETSAERYRELLEKAVRELDTETVYLVLVHVVGVLGDFESLEWILGAARDRRGGLFERIEDICEELRRTALFRRVRRNLRDPELRFFFGALYLARDRETVYDLVARRFPGRDPEGLVARWIAEVTRRPVARTEPAWGDASEGLLTARLFQWMARGHSFEECFALVHQGHKDFREPSANTVREIFQKIQGTALFRPLFTELEAA